MKKIYYFFRIIIISLMTSSVLNFTDIVSADDTNWYALTSQNQSAITCNIENARLTLNLSTNEKTGKLTTVQNVSRNNSEVVFPESYDTVINQETINSNYDIFLSTTTDGILLPKNTGRWGTCVKSQVEKKVYQSTKIKAIAINKTCTNNVCTVGVLINGRVLNSGHPFCQGEFNLYKKGEKTPIILCDYLDTDGIDEIRNDSSRTAGFKADEVFNDATFSMIEVGEGKYLYDNQPPHCASSTQVVYEDDKTQNYNGEWTYKNLLYRAKCDDSYGNFGQLSGCVNAFSDWKKADGINTSTTIPVSFIDKVGNQGSDQCNVGKLLIDRNVPTLQKPIYIVGDDTTEIEPPKTSNTPQPNQPISNIGTTTIEMYADPFKIQGTVLEEATESGIQSVKMTAYQAQGNPTAICDFDTKVKDISSGLPKPYISSSPLKTGNESTPDTYPFSFETSVTKTVGCYRITLEAVDNVGNKTQRIFNIAVVPNLEIKTTTQPKGSTGIYANNLDEHTFTVCVEDKYGNKIHSKNFSDLTYEGSNLILPNGGNTALKFSKSSFTTDLNGCGEFSLTSYMPGKIEHNFSMKYNNWNEEYQDIHGSVKNLYLPTLPSGPSEFLKLYTSEMNFSSEGIENTNPVTAKLTIGASNEVTLVENKEAADFSKILTNTIKLNNTDIKSPENAPYIFFGLKSDTSSFPVVCSFVGATYKNICFFTQALQGITAKDELNIQARPMISYKFTDGTFAQYQLSPSNTGLSDEPVTLSGGTLNGIYIGGQQRVEGKEDIVSNMQSIGGLKGYEFADAIRKQVALTTRNRDGNGDVVSKVYYKKGSNVALNSVYGNWETIIIEEGNLIIDTNLEDRNNAKGIIVLNGNVYIKPDVTKLSAMIFTDGSVESVDTSGNIFTKSDMTRTKSLTKQLTIYGGLFSRNTIGGAILGNLGDVYVLPGGKDTDSLDEAVRYDLSFLRMYNYQEDGTTAWDITVNKAWHEGHKESTVIIPNPALISNPPAVFDFKE